MYEQIKEETLRNVGEGRASLPKGQAKYQIGSYLVHVRFCATNQKHPTQYKFNINPNTLSADFELWICGEATSYYLVHTQILQNIYSHPKAYPDRHHPRIRVVSVDVSTHRLSYAVGEKPLDMLAYRGAKLPDDYKSETVATLVKEPLVDYHDIITIDPNTRSGKPCIRGTRITVYDILEYLAAGMTESEILADFPELTHRDIQACLAFAADRERKLFTVNT